MREKDIRRQVTKQLKKEFPNWRRLPKKEKKRIAKEVLQNVVASYSSAEPATAIPIHELTNTPIPMPGMIKLAEMEQFMAKATRGLLRFPVKRWPKRYGDPELGAIGALVDDRVVNELLAPEGYTPSMRDLYPSHYLRAELLKSLRYAEISYRKYCSEVINRLDSKRQRAFIHLPLHRAVTMDHTQLSRFRSSLTEECFHAPVCSKCREIPLDAGLFGQIPDQVYGVEQAGDIRKHMERCFNLLKHREGLEPLRVKSQHATLVAATLAQMATMVLEIVGTRKTENREERPKQRKMACC